MSNAPASTMEHHMRFTFRLPPQLMVDYAHMQARIKKREAAEWERFANSVAEYFQASEEETRETQDAEVPNEPVGIVAETIVEKDSIVIEKTEPASHVEPVSYKLTSTTKKESTGKVHPNEVVEETKSKKESTGKVRPTEVEETKPKEEESLAQTHDDNVSESGKRTVVRWTGDEDDYLKELMIRFDNDFAKVAKEMKTRNARQCKARWELLNRPVNEETGKKKRSGGAKKGAEEELTNEGQ